MFRSDYGVGREAEVTRELRDAKLEIGGGICADREAPVRTFWSLSLGVSDTFLIPAQTDIPLAWLAPRLCQDSQAHPRLRSNSTTEYFPCRSRLARDSFGGRYQALSGGKPALQGGAAPIKAAIRPRPRSGDPSPLRGCSARRTNAARHAPGLRPALAGRDRRSSALLRP